MVGISIGVAVLILAFGYIIYFCVRTYCEKLRNYCKKWKQSEQGSESGVRYETFTNPRENKSENHSFMRQVSQVSESESVASVAEKQDHENLEKETETTQTETQREGGNTGTEHVRQTITAIMWLTQRSNSMKSFAASDTEYDENSTTSSRHSAENHYGKTHLFTS